MTAFLVATVAWATAQTAQSTLPAGTAVVFVSEGHFDGRARPGSNIRAHLKDDLSLDGTILAPAGTVARLVLTGIAKNGKQTVDIEDFTTRYGLLPVGSATANADAMNAGVEIRTATLAKVVHLRDRFAIEVPFPFKIGTDTPASVYTPTPARTAPPIMRPAARPRHRPKPTPTPTPAPSPSDAATKIPG